MMRNAADAPMSVAVVIASAGRPGLLVEAIESCSAQRGIDFRGVVSVPDTDSLPLDRSLLRDWLVLTGVTGSAAQRNAGIAVLGDADVVAFFDDDSVVRPDYLANAVGFLIDRPDVIGLTGRVLMDGAQAGEIDHRVAVAAIERSELEPMSGRWHSTRELYGCNLVVRFSSAMHVRFDERLPLYSWLEDHDLARQLLRLGTLVKVEDCVIVHRGAGSGGRQAHLRLGYSQVMNPVYLLRKGTFPVWLAAQQISRPLVKNVALGGFGRSRSWRRRRLRGNCAAILDVLRGRITPERIVDL